MSELAESVGRPEDIFLKVAQAWGNFGGTAIGPNMRYKRPKQVENYGAPAGGDQYDAMTAGLDATTGAGIGTAAWSKARNAGLGWGETAAKFKPVNVARDAKAVWNTGRNVASTTARGAQGGYNAMRTGYQAARAGMPAFGQAVGTGAKAVGTGAASAAKAVPGAMSTMWSGAKTMAGPASSLIMPGMELWDATHDDGKFNMAKLTSGRASDESAAAYEKQLSGITNQDWQNDSFAGVKSMGNAINAGLNLPVGGANWLGNRLGNAYVDNHEATTRSADLDKEMVVSRHQRELKDLKDSGADQQRISELRARQRSEWSNTMNKSGQAMDGYAAAGPANPVYGPGAMMRPGAGQPPIRRQQNLTPTSFDILQKVTGDTSGIAPMAAYFIPGIGTIATGYDTVASATNIFRRGQSLKERAGHALNTLGMAGMTAATLLPFAGGAAKMLGRVGKWTGSKGLRGAAASSLGSVRGARQVLKTDPGMAAKLYRYASGTGARQQALKGQKGVFGLVNPFNDANVFRQGMSAFQGQGAGIGSRLATTGKRIAYSPMVGSMGVMTAGGLLAAPSEGYTPQEMAQFGVRPAATQYLRNDYGQYVDQYGRPAQRMMRNQPWT